MKTFIFSKNRGRSNKDSKDPILINASSRISYILRKETKGIDFT